MSRLVQIRANLDPNLNIFQNQQEMAFPPAGPRAHAHALTARK